MLVTFENVTITLDIDRPNATATEAYELLTSALGALERAAIGEEPTGVFVEWDTTTYTATNEDSGEVKRGPTSELWPDD